MGCQSSTDAVSYASNSQNGYQDEARYQVVQPIQQNYGNGQPFKENKQVVNNAQTTANKPKPQQVYNNQPGKAGKATQQPIINQAQPVTVKLNNGTTYKVQPQPPQVKIIPSNNPVQANTKPVNQVINQIPSKPEQNKIHEQSQIMKSLVKMFKGKDDLGNFHGYIWQFLEKKAKQYYFYPDQSYQFFDLIHDMIEFNFSNSPQQLYADSEKLGRKYGKIFNRLHFKQEQVIKFLKIMISQDQISIFGLPKTFIDFKYDMSIQNHTTKDNLYQQFQQKYQLNQLLYVAEHTFRFCKMDMGPFAFLSLYLRQSIKKLFKSEKNVKRLQQILQENIKKLCKLYPEIQANDEMSTQEGHQQLTIKQNGQNKVDFQVVNFSSEETENTNFKQLQEYIVKKSLDAKQQHPLFDQLISSVCKKYGYGFLSGVKIKGKHDSTSIWRTIQKLLQRKEFQTKFKDFKDSIYMKFNQKMANSQISLQQLVDEQKKQAKMFIQNLVNQSSSLVFDSKDLVRGKCIYSKPEDIIKTVKLLKQKMKQYSGKGVQIIELKNEMVKKNMVKIIIKLPKSIAQLQLVLNLQKVGNQFNHKLYELARSKIYTIVTNLYVLNQKWCTSFFYYLSKNIKFIMTEAKPQQGLYPQQRLKLLNESQRFFNQILLENNKSIKLQCPDEIIETQKSQKNLIEAKCPKLMAYLRSTNVNSMKKKQYIHQLLNNMKFLFHGAQYDQYIREYQTVQILEEEKDMKQYLQLITITQKVYRSLGKSENAKILYQEKYEIIKKTVPKDEFQTAQLNLELGSFKLNEQQIDQAMDYFTQALQIFEKLNNKIKYAQAIRWVGQIHFKKSRIQKSIQSYNKALQIFNKQIGKETLQYAKTLNLIAYVYSLDGPFDQALVNYNQVLAIYEKLVGKQSIQCMNILTHVGFIHFNQARYDKSLLIYKQSLPIIQKLLTNNSVTYAETMHRMTLIYQQLQKYEEGYQTAQQCLRVYFRNYGEDQYNQYLREAEGLVQSFHTYVYGQNQPGFDFQRYYAVRRAK